MAGYGRLEVFFPDGMNRTYLLTVDNVSVGRQPGNVIPLDTDTISRYHLTITHKDDEVTITDLDSANGTFVDGVRLHHDESRALIGGEEILIGDLRLFYYSLDESPTRPNTPLIEEPARHVEADRASFHVEMDEPEIAVPPGAHTSAELRVINRGKTSERFVVEVTGVPKQWVRVDRPEFDLRPDDPTYIQISFKPLRQPSSTPGSYPVTVTVRPKHDASKALQCVITLTVLPYSGFGMALEKRMLAPQQPFRVHLHNQGSTNLALSITGRGVEDDVRVQVLPEQAVLKPDQRLVVNGAAAPKHGRAFGSPRRYAFDIVVRSGDAAAYTVAQRAYVTERPRLPGWAVYGLLGLAALFVVGVVAVLLLVSRPPAAPEISDFSVQPAEVMAGQPIQVAWAAQGADSLVLTVNGAAEQTVEGNSGSVTLPTDGLEGTVRIALQASNAGGETSAEATAVVTASLTIAAFNGEPPALVRYTVQPVTFAWSAPGAATVTLIGTEALTATQVDDALPGEGTLTVTAYVISPESEILITLLAQDTSGRSVQQALALPVADPLCTPMRDTSLYASPFRSAQVISTVPAGTPVVVDARNQNGAWVRVRLGGFRGWGELVDLTCAGGFTINSLQPDPTVPLAMPTPPPTVTRSLNLPTEAPAPAASATPGVIIQPGAAATPTESQGARG